MSRINTRKYNMSHKNINIIFWNARSIVNKKGELEMLLNVNVDICIIVESWLSEKHNNFNIAGFKTVRKDRAHGKGGGILILVRNDLAFKMRSDIVSPDISVELAGVSITNVNPKLEIIACYRAPESSLTDSQWEDILNKVKDKSHTLFVGDFNAHHTSWNCSKNDSNGIHLYNSYISKNLFLHNNNTLTYIQPYSTYETNIDLVFSSNMLSDKIDVSVGDDTRGSDHFPINVIVNVEKHLYFKKTFRIRSSKTDWEKFYEYLDLNIDQLYTINFDVSKAREKYNIFTELINRAIEFSTPARKKVSPAQYRNPVAWWDSECDKAIRLRKASFKKWKFTKNSNDFTAYKKNRAFAIKLIKNKKREFHKLFSLTINFRVKQKYVWNTLKILKNKWAKVTHSLTTENHQTSAKIDIALDKISPSWCATNPDWIPDCVENDFLSMPFTYSEFNLALCNKKTKSSPGMDGIDYFIIQQLPIKYSLILLDIMNEMYIKSDFPENWRKSYVHFIEKTDGKSVRPIYLSSCICKLFETMTKNRLQYWVEQNNFLPNSQSGFRKGQSTSDNLANLLMFIEEAFEGKRDVLAAFLDVAGAFDNVDLNILLKRLADIKCPSTLLKFIRFLMHERIIFTDVTGNAPRKVYKGVPQGGVLSPLLYCIYVANIVQKIPKTIKISQFADDIAIYGSRKNINSCQKLLTNTIDKIYKSLYDLGLELCAEKTTFIHFNKRNIKPGNTEIKIRNHSIKSSNAVKFLGITFDYRLNFREHIDKIHSKCLKTLNLLKFLRGTWWGCDPDSLIAIYKSYVRSIIDYSCYIFFPTQKMSIEKIEKIQHIAIRLALGYRNTTPTNVLLAETKLPLLQERAKFLCANYLLKILSHKELLVHKNLIRFSKTKSKRLIKQCLDDVSKYSDIIISENQYHIYRYNYETFFHEIKTNVQFGKTIQQSTDPDSLIDNLLAKEEAVAIYTDGSKTQDAPSVGSSAICMTLDKYVTVSTYKEASIFTAECIGILYAVELASICKSNKYIIFTDSLSAVMSIENKKINIRTNPYIYLIKNKILEFRKKSKGNNIQIFWIPSHKKGLQGNDLADSLAKEASRLVPDQCCKIPFTDLKGLYKSKSKENTCSAIIENSKVKGSMYFTYYYNHESKPWYFNKPLPRKIITIINRCRSGHYSLAASLAKCNLINDPFCNCNENRIQDLDHILWQCPRFDEQRKNFIADLKKQKFQQPLASFVILRDPSTKMCESLLKFFEHCKLLM